jgi:pyrroline-5-carboxylate reductase
MKYGFVGTGNMAQTMIKGFINNHALKPEDIFVYDIDPQKQTDVVNKYGVRPCRYAKEVAESVDVLVLAIKPDQLVDVLISVNIKPMPILISLPVGITMRTIAVERLKINTAPIIRIIPNISAEVFASVTAFCANENITETQKNEIIRTLEALGSVIELPESKLDIFTVIASSAPAFVIKFTEALAEAALKEGLPKGTARKIITEMLYGTSLMLREHSPFDITDRICSPGGTTIAGLCALTKYGFETAIHEAAADCMRKLKCTALQEK